MMQSDKRLSVSVIKTQVYYDNDDNEFFLFFFFSLVTNLIGIQRHNAQITLFSYRLNGQFSIFFSQAL